MSLAVGRVPSCVPREAFRAKLGRDRGPTFEDCVIFVHDIEACMHQLDAEMVQLVSRIALQEFTLREVEQQTGVSRCNLARAYYRALDQLSTLLLTRGLLSDAG